MGQYNVTCTPISFVQPGAKWRAKNPGRKILWQPEDPEKTPMSKYRQHINTKFHVQLKTSKELHKWTVDNPHEFWCDLYSYVNIIPPLPPSVKYAYDPQAEFRSIPKWFEGHEINFAENLLLPNVERAPDAIAVTGLREGGLDDPEHVTWAELKELVRLTRNALMHHGVKKDDVVAALMSNSIWIIVIFLATASIGAVFTSIAPDMGLSGCVSRLNQVRPAILFADIDFATRGTRQRMDQKVKDVLQQLSKYSLSVKAVFVPTSQAAHKQTRARVPRASFVPQGLFLHDFLCPVLRDQTPIDFERVSTSHSLVILYSSGTTGMPKCLVSPHISVLNYLKIALLHNSLGPDSTVFQYSSTSWILWNVTMGHALSGSRIITYDGSPLFPDAGTPLEICERYGVTYWGTSPRYLVELEQQATRGSLKRQYDLSTLRLVTTTGAPLLPSQMEFFYSPCFPSSVTLEKTHLSSVCGGTEVASSWCASDPAGPVYLDEMQMWALGHDCDILPQDATSVSETILQLKDGSRRRVKLLDWKPIETRAFGELVCRKPFPSAPVFFHGDDENNSKYTEAYFRRFPTFIDAVTNEPLEYMDIWAQHDLVTKNPDTQGLRVVGRSDTTLNPSGIRFGSSEIYNIIEANPFNTLISDSLCVGRRRKGDNDEAVFLFIIPAKGTIIDDGLVNKIRDAIKTNLSPRHVPKFIFKVNEIPITINGKKTENVIKKIISGIEVTPSSTITNPKCLEDYFQYRNVERVTSKL